MHSTWCWYYIIRFILTEVVADSAEVSETAAENQKPQRTECKKEFKQEVSSGMSAGRSHKVGWRIFIWKEKKNKLQARSEKRGSNKNGEHETAREKVWEQREKRGGGEWLSQELLHKIHVWSSLWQTHQIMRTLWKLQEVPGDRRSIAQADGDMKKVWLQSPQRKLRGWWEVAFRGAVEYVCAMRMHVYKGGAPCNRISTWREIRASCYSLMRGGTWSESDGVPRAHSPLQKVPPDTLCYLQVSWDQPMNHVTRWFPG